MAWFGLDPWAEMYRMESQMNDLMDMIDYAQFVPTTGRHHRQQPRMSRQIQQQQASTPIASAPAKDTSADSAAAPKEGTAAEPQADKAPSSPTATTTAVTSTTPTSKAVQPREPEWESIWWPRTDLRETDAQYSVWFFRNLSITIIHIRSNNNKVFSTISC
ncbi:hypothetical protein Pelo_16304 [Pelomyxa schiedti]|nr:hypothetical protein Pelo_16304 [Pelomyxa schiedti]